MDPSEEAGAVTMRMLAGHFVSLGASVWLARSYRFCTLVGSGVNFIALQSLRWVFPGQQIPFDIVQEAMGTLG